LIEKVILAEKTSYQLSMLKGKTGLNNGPICRIALCLSLKDPSLPKFAHYDKKGREIDKTGFFQLYEREITALVKQRCYQDKFDLDNDLEKYLLGHLNRGIEILNSRIKKIEDLIYIFE